MPVSVFKTLATFFSPKNLLYMKNFYCMYLPYTENSQQVADQLEKKDFRIVWLKRARNFCPFRTYSIISTVQVENLQQVAANSGSEMLQWRAKLFGVGALAISKHLKNIFDEGELDKDVVVSKMEITTQHGAIEEKTQTHKVVFVPLHPLEPAKPLNDAQMCGSFYFYTFPLLRFSYFQTVLISLWILKIWEEIVMR